MAMDKNDSRLVNGAIMAAVVFAVVYFWPAGWLGMSGYSALADQEASARENLEKTSPNFAQHFWQIQPVHYGKNGDPIPSIGDVAPIKGLHRLYDDANEYTQEKIKEKQAANKIAFPDWTETEERDVGTYFRKVWENHKRKVEIACTNAKVELDDADIGFTKLSSNIPDKPKALELLRELYIAEKIIDLCIQAKNSEELRQKRAGIETPDAYMRIMEVEPRDSEPTGPSALVANPKYDPNDKNPASAKFRKYNVESWPVFIQEYPVKIQLICDTYTFTQFMHSVRTPKDPRFEFTGCTDINGQKNPTLKCKELGRILSPVKVGDTIPEYKYMVSRIDPLGIWLTDDQGNQTVVLEGQFLVIRQLEILSPALDDSLRDKTEQHKFKSDNSDPTAKKHWPDRKDLIVVTIIAAGMDFFDPRDYPNGIGPVKVQTVARPKPGRRSLSGSAGANGNKIPRTE